MRRRLVVGALVVAITASVAGFPFEVLDQHAWSGLSFVVWSLGLFTAAGLLAITSGRMQDDLGAIGFSAVALYALGTTLNSSLLARDLPEVSVGIQPGVWAMLALGLLLIGFSGRTPSWARVAGVVAAAGHAAAATAVLFGAELPPTGGEASSWPSLIIALSKLALWTAMVGWILTARHETPDEATTPSDARERTLAGP